MLSANVFTVTWGMLDFQEILSGFQNKKKKGKKILPQYILMLGFNPYLTNGFSHHYHLGESTSVLRGIRCDF